MLRSIWRGYKYVDGHNAGKAIRDIVDIWKPNRLRPKLDALDLYTPKRLLEFDDNGTLLIYKYTQPISRTVWQFTKPLFKMITSFALLYINPYPCNLYIVNTEPLVAPVLLGYGLVSAFKLIKQVFTYQLTLHEVRLKKDGMHIEIGTLSYLGRELEKGKFTVNIQELKPPPIYSDSAPMTGDLFPTHPEEFKIANYVKNPWVKYYSEVRAKYYIPKDYDYMDTDLMIAIMDGKFINTYDY